MSERKPKARVPELLVERLAAGELAPDEARAVRARLEEEEGGLERLDAIRRSNEEILAAYPPSQVAREVAERLRVEKALARERARKPALWVGLPVAAALAALAVVVLSPERPALTSDDGEETILLKGAEPRLRVFVRDPAGARALTDGDHVSSGDVLQVAYAAAGQAFGVVVSLDGRGELTLHLPHASGMSPALDPSGLVRLPHAFELDDAPRYERFFFVTSNEPFASSLVEDAVRELAARGSAETGTLELPAGMGQVTLLLRKDAAVKDR